MIMRASSPPPISGAPRRPDEPDLMSPAKKPCERCAGSGRTPRLQRRRADGSLDPLDIVGRHSEVCDKCGGAGEVPADPPSATMRQPGYVADLG
jgi:DnaJ-class molecular chaperone